MNVSHPIGLDCKIIICFKSFSQRARSIRSAVAYQRPMESSVQFQDHISSESGGTVFETQHYDKLPLRNKILACYDYFSINHTCLKNPNTILYTSIHEETHMYSLICLYTQEAPHPQIPYLQVYLSTDWVRGLQRVFGHILPLEGKSSVVIF